MSRRDLDDAEDRIRSAYRSYYRNVGLPLILAGVCLTVLPVLFLAGIFVLMWLWR